MNEIQPGLWHWQTPHPDWTPDERWPQEVSSYAIDDGARLLLFDPLSVPDELLELAANRKTRSSAATRSSTSATGSGSTAGSVPV